jgi:hypothetical protein
MLKKLSMYCLPLLLVACAQDPVKPVAMQIAITQPLPPLAVEFETVVDQTSADGEIYQSSHRWRFWRDHNYVETLNLDDDSGEVWRKAENGDIGYQRLFHDQQQLIDYLPGDLHALDAVPDWNAVTSLLNPAALAALRGGDAVKILDLDAQRYSGQLHGQALKVLWLPTQQLPALIETRQPGQRIVTRLQAIFALPRSPWPYRRASAYGVVDFADIGDKENDPFIKSILPRLKGSNLHQH